MVSADLQPPLVGRDYEIKFLEELLQQSSAGRGRLVLIAGEAGIGKSRLADEFGKLAANKGIRVAVGRCVRGARSPYLPFQEALRTLVKVVEERDLGLRSWLKGPGATFEEHRRRDLALQSESERTLYAVLESLREISAKQAVLLVLDDLHWADSASIQLLHFLARNSDGLRTLLVGTYRPEDLATEGEGRTHPLLESLRIMRREGICHELPLDRLNPDELRLAVDGMLGAPIHEEIFKEIASESAGNPLFAVESVRWLVQTKSITFHDGIWKPAGEVRIDIPSTIREVIFNRIERLTREERRVLEGAAVMGESFDPYVIGEALHADRLHLLEILESIEKNFQLVEASDRLYRFSHEKVRQIMYEQISLPRRRELHRLMGQVLETQTVAEALYARLSLHFCIAEDRNKCVKYSLLAGRGSLQRFALKEAINYFQEVVDGARDDPSFAEERLQALEGLGDANRMQGLYETALSFYQAFLNLCHSSRDIARVLRKSAVCWFPTTKANPSKVKELLDQAEKCGDIETIEQGRIKRLRGNTAVYLGAFAEAENLYSEAERLFEQTGATEELANMLLDYGELYLSEGVVKQALDKGKRAAQLFSTLQSPSGQLLAYYQLGDTYLHLGLVEDALESYARGIEIAIKLGRYSTLAWSHIYRAIVYYSVDDFAAGTAEATKGREYAQKTESHYVLSIANTVLAQCEIYLNRIERAEGLLRESLELLEKVPMDIRTPLRPFTISALALLHAAKRDWTTSDEKFRQSIELIQGAVYGLLYEAMIRTRFGEALLKQGRNSEAQEQFTKAVELYERLGNVPQAQRVGKLAARLD